MISGNTERILILASEITHTSEFLVIGRIFVKEAVNDEKFPHVTKRNVK